VRQALHVVRKAAGGEAVAERDGRLTLAGGSVDVDVHQLAAALSAHELERAHALWRGGPFAHFSLADAPAFNDWADRVRSRWERRLGEALSSRGMAEREAGRDEEALAWLGRALDVRPFDEAAHALRVDVLLELGLLDEAEAALERARSVVDEPTPGVLEELESRLRALRRDRVHDAPDDGGAAPALAYVGRTAEMAELRAVWRSALSGRPRSVAILGEAGIGKSRLAEEWLRHTVGPDATVVRVKALDTERALAMGMAAEAAKALASKPGAAGMSNASLAVLRHLVPTLGNGHGPTASSSLSEVAVSEALLDLAEAVAHEAPLVLLLEDLQWADALSRGVLLRMARSLRGVQALTLVTCRSGDADLSAVRVLRAEAAEGRFSTLELRALHTAEVHEALTLSLEVRPSADAPRVAARLASASQGNPLFLRELLLRLHAEGLITDDAGHWVLRGGDVGESLPLPRSVREILEARLREVPEACHPLLGALGHAERPLTAPELAARLGELPRALDELVARGILQRDDDGRLTFTHDTLRHAARDLFPSPAGTAPHGARRLARWLWLPAALATAAATALAWPRPADPPLYPGVIYVSEDGLLHRYLVPSKRGGAWDTLPPLPVPEGVHNVDLSPRADGGVDLYGHVYSEGANGVPNVVRVTPAGGWERLLDHPHDVNFGGVSPGGRHSLLFVADESTGRYRVSLTRYDLATGDTLVYGTPAERAGGNWVLDGSALVAQATTRVDTLILLRPDGTRLAQRVIVPEDYVKPPSPCGPSPQRLLGLRWVPGGLALEWSGWDDAPPVLLPTFRFPPAAVPFCSPDGAAAVMPAMVAGVTRLVVFDLATGDTLLGPAVSGLYGVRWAPDRPLPVPAAVEAHDDQLTLGWGEARPVGATVRLADGTPGEDHPVSWTSLDPAVATVRDGVVYANGVGTARLVVSVQGWMADTVHARVTGASLAGEALLADPFTAFDTAAWAVFGHPSPMMAQTADGPALDLNGDGVGVDGIFSRRRFDLARGATLEFTFRLPLTRQDRQALTACLAAGPTPAEAGAGSSYWSATALCFGYPAGESPRFDPSAIVLAGGAAPPPVRVPGLPTDGWVRAALVLAPDGNGRLLLNQREVARLPFPIHKAADQRWYVLLHGRAADTQLFIRDLVLWEGTRY
jgi:DNA-binding SARP family transcriptional activator